MLAPMKESRYKELMLSVRQQNAPTVKKVNLDMPIRLDLMNMRIASGMSINKLSKVSKVARSYISELEAGIYINPSVEILVKIAKAFDCKLDDLVKY